MTSRERGMVGLLDPYADEVDRFEGHVVRARVAAQVQVDACGVGLEVMVVDALYIDGPVRGRMQSKFWILLLLAAIIATAGVVAIPLGYGTLSVALDEQLASRAKPLADAWASGNKWVVTTLSAADNQVVITALGSPPDADVTTLRQTFNDNGLADAGLVVRLVLGGTATCPAGGTTCTLSTD